MSLRRSRNVLWTRHSAASRRFNVTYRLPRALHRGSDRRFNCSTVNTGLTKLQLSEARRNLLPRSLGQTVPVDSILCPEEVTPWIDFHNSIGSRARYGLKGHARLGFGGMGWRPHRQRRVRVSAPRVIETIHQARARRGGYGTARCGACAVAEMCWLSREDAGGVEGATRDSRSPRDGAKESRINTAISWIHGGILLELSQAETGVLGFDDGRLRPGTGGLLLGIRPFASR
jgi:hypothetical protein